MRSVLQKNRLRAIDADECLANMEVDQRGACGSLKTASTNSFLSQSERVLLGKFADFVEKKKFAEPLQLVERLQVTCVCLSFRSASTIRSLT